MSINWQLLWDLCSSEEFPELMTLVLLQICEMCCPRKQSVLKGHSSSTRIASRKKRKIQYRFNEAKQNPTTPVARFHALERKLLLAHADIHDAVNKDLQYREMQAVNKIHTNPKYFFSYAKKFSKQKHNILMLFDENNDIVSCPKQIGDVLQRQFNSVFSDPSKTKIESATFDQPPLKSPHFDELIEFSKEDIMEAIDEIKPSAAAGPDEIPVSLLKNCKSVLAEPIHLIWSNSLNTGTVPGCYKTSHIAPIHKKGSRAIASNYRPVSLTSHIIKIYERVMRKQMITHLENNNLLRDNQHGFRAGKSCLTQLLHHFDDILESLGKDIDTDAIYLDYAKAFDKVDHNLLLKKLEIYGFNPKIVKWIRSFLSNRSQHVVIDGYKSFVSLIISGVPQGTVLGPILFIIYINDITEHVSHSTIRCFADDTRVCKSIADCSNILELQQDLDSVIQWSSRNNMALHEEKFEYICHKANKHNLLDELPFAAMQYQYKTANGMILSPVSHLRDLGITVSCDLSWSTHIRAICDKARQMAGWVFSVFHSRNRDTMILLYKSLVRCHLEFCSPLWNPTKISDIQELESVQRAFSARINAFQHLHYWDRLKKLGLMSLQRRRERFIVLHMWKICHGSTPNELKIRFEYNNRMGLTAKVPPLHKGCALANQTLYENSFGVRGPRIWNCIPADLRAIQRMDTFKSKLTEFLLIVPDTPPIRGYTPINSNSILEWRNNRDASALWGGRRI